jgi:hypothetical protein
MDFRKAIHGKPYLNILWFVIAFVCVAASILQIQISLAKERAEKNKALPPPAKTRHFLREAPPAKPVPDYASRRKQGLSDRQIGWIIQDFQFVGLDQGIRAATPEDYLKQRKQQDRWYCDLMAEAWGYGPDQTALMTAKLDELFKQAKEQFTKELAEASAPIEQNGKWYRIVSSQPIHRLIDFRSRLPDLPKPDDANPEVPQVAPDDFQIINSLMPAVSDTSPMKSPGDGSKLPFFQSLHPAQFKLYLLLQPTLAGELQKELNAAPTPERLIANPE